MTDLPLKGGPVVRMKRVLGPILKSYLQGFELGWPLGASSHLYAA